MVPRSDAGRVQGLDSRPSAGDPAISLVRPCARMAGLFLAGSNSSGLFAAHAMFREQYLALRSRRKRRLQQERLVAGAVTIDSVGRKLAPGSSLERRLGAPRVAMVADGHWLVFHLRPRSRRSGQ